ncbi:glycoside hydrolase superfamily [Auriculariales sp. MPI-PUGE-AT-0066]|nr:glycoside hydrolase superfamily [Auriculariales sp. MPI-PUGE-AT-0066]
MGGDQGCDQKSCFDGVCTEFDLVKKLGQDAADTAFGKHWDSFITKDDVDLIKQYNLNSVRIPLGFWIIEETVNRDNEYYPRGGLEKLRQMCGWFADAGITVLLDLHAAPGGSTATNAFAGRCVDPPQFWGNQDNMSRHLAAAKKLTELVHQEPEHFRTVWGLEMLNEPPQNGAAAPGYAQLMKDFVSTVRGAEASLGVEEQNRIQTVFMDKSWMWENADGNNPAFAASGGSAYDAHTYFSFGSGAWGANGWHNGESLDELVQFACEGDGGKLADGVKNFNDPIFTGEWWLLGREDTQTKIDPFDKDSVRRFGDAQKWGRSKQAGKGGNGYYFWSWKITNEDGGGYTHMRSYKTAVEQGYLHEDAAQYFNPNVCG